MGPILIVIALVVVIPVLVILSGGIAAAVIGIVSDADNAKRHEGSELADLNS